MDWNAILHSIVSWATTTGVKIIISLIVLFISFKIVNSVVKKIQLAGEKKNADKTILKTLCYVLKIALKCLIAICLVGYLGIDTSGVTALVTSLGVCAGLAVNGALANLAGGVLIILTRPFKVDDYIEAQDVSGTVAAINITNTKLVTPDNKVVYVPNGTLANGNIINYSEKDTRRVDLEFSVSYDSDPDLAKALIFEITNAHELILKDPAPSVRISAHGESGMKISCKVWTKSSDYWKVHFDLIEAVKADFDENNIKIPHNQLDVHLKNESEK